MRVTTAEGGIRAFCRERDGKHAGKLSRQILYKSRFKRRYAGVILVVDGDPAILQVRRLVLEVLGYPVLTASSGEEALKCLQRNSVDLVVLDYLMPGMDGEQTARRIRRLHTEIPIVLSSSCLSIPQSALEIVNASVDKVRMQTLVVVVEQLLQRRPAGSQQSLRPSSTAFY